MDLQTLIRRRRGARSLQDLANVSGLVKQTWATHANPPEGGGRRMPEAETIKGIAKGLDVSPRAVVLAIGETLGVIPPDQARPPLLDLLPDDEVLRRLTAEDVDTVVRLVALLAARAEETPSPAPTRGRRAPVERSTSPARESRGGQQHLPFVAAAAGV